MIKLNHHNAAPFYFHRIGRWWDRQSEIDLVALNPETRQSLFVECKWTSTPVGPDVLQTLKHRAQNLPTADAFYLITSKSGFTDPLKNLRDPPPPPLGPKRHRDIFISKKIGANTQARPNIYLTKF